MVLYINSCTRKYSRTDRIARALLAELGEYTEVRPEKEGLRPLTEETLDRRTALIAAGDYSDPMFRFAKQFAEADVIVISAPFWDLSLPSALKVYIENIYVTGIVSRYGEDGAPVGMCRARRLYYVTTAGGPYVPDYSYDYIRDLALNYFGIGETELIFAENLDIIGSDADAIVEITINGLRGKN